MTAALAPAKTLLGWGMAALNRQCRYDRACFLIGHMRCGSTALSAILVSRNDLSGYGEAHIRYATRADLGLLAINQWRRGAWNRRAGGLFDKILHNRYEVEVPPSFFAARALFMAREPIAAIHSTRQLFTGIGSEEYASDQAAAEYYCDRLEAMLALWRRFPDDRRVALTYDALVATPEAVLAQISRRLGFTPPLVNRYRITAAAQARGAGDPTNAGRFEQIIAMPPSAPRRDLIVTSDTLARARSLFDRFCVINQDNDL